MGKEIKINVKVKTHDDHNFQGLSLPSSLKLILHEICLNITLCYKLKGGYAHFNMHISHF